MREVAGQAGPRPVFYTAAALARGAVFMAGNGVEWRINPARKEMIMPYVTITTWEIAGGADYDLSLRSIREKRLPALKELGATRVTLVRTSDRTSAAITE